MFGNHPFTPQSSAEGVVCSGTTHFHPLSFAFVKGKSGEKGKKTKKMEYTCQQFVAFFFLGSIFHFHFFPLFEHNNQRNARKTCHHPKIVELIFFWMTFLCGRNPSKCSFGFRFAQRAKKGQLCWGGEHPICCLENCLHDYFFFELLFFCF